MAQMPSVFLHMHSKAYREIRHEVVSFQHGFVSRHLLYISLPASRTKSQLSFFEELLASSDCVHLHSCVGLRHGLALCLPLVPLCPKLVRSLCVSSGTLPIA